MVSVLAQARRPPSRAGGGQRSNSRQPPPRGPAFAGQAPHRGQNRYFPEPEDTYRHPATSLEGLLPWQVYRLEQAFAGGRRKAQVKQLAEDLDVDRSLVLAWFKDFQQRPASQQQEIIRQRLAEMQDGGGVTRPAPDLIALRKKLASNLSQAKEREDEEDEGKGSGFVPFYVRRQQQRNSPPAEKKLKVDAIRTLEALYARTAYPSDAMIRGLWDLHRIPRTTAIDWFRDRREQNAPKASTKPRNSPDSAEPTAAESRAAHSLDASSKSFTPELAGIVENTFSPGGTDSSELSSTPAQRRSRNAASASEALPASSKATESATSRGKSKHMDFEGVKIKLQDSHPIPPARAAEDVAVNTEYVAFASEALPADKVDPAPASTSSTSLPSSSSAVDLPPSLLVSRGTSLFPRDRELSPSDISGTSASSSDSAAVLPAPVPGPFHPSASSRSEAFPSVSNAGSSPLMSTPIVEPTPTGDNFTSSPTPRELASTSTTEDSAASSPTADITSSPTIDNLALHQTQKLSILSGKGVPGVPGGVSQDPSDPSRDTPSELSDRPTPQPSVGSNAIFSGLPSPRKLKDGSKWAEVKGSMRQAMKAPANKAAAGEKLSTAEQLTEWAVEMKDELGRKDRRLRTLEQAAQAYMAVAARSPVSSAAKTWNRFRLKNGIPRRKKLNWGAWRSKSSREDAALLQWLDTVDLNI